MAYNLSVSSPSLFIFILSISYLHLIKRERVLWQLYLLGTSRAIIQNSFTPAILSRRTRYRVTETRTYTYASVKDADIGKKGFDWSILDWTSEDTEANRRKPLHSITKTPTYTLLLFPPDFDILSTYCPSSVAQSLSRTSYILGYGCMLLEVCLLTPFAPKPRSNPRPSFLHMPAAPRLVKDLDCIELADVCSVLGH
jgi:hypothetical protein